MADPLALSLLNDYLYCPRRAALKAVEGHREENEHTVRGDIVHEHADLPGDEVAKGVSLLRALPVWSERLGLSGKCDIVEVHPAAAEVTRLTASNPKSEIRDPKLSEPANERGGDGVQSGNILYRTDREHPLQFPNYALARKQNY